jgi:hypothetical protein
VNTKTNARSKSGNTKQMIDLKEGPLLGEYPSKLAETVKLIREKIGKSEKKESLISEVLLEAPISGFYEKRNLEHYLEKGKDSYISKEINCNFTKFPKTKYTLSPSASIEKFIDETNIADSIMYVLKTMWNWPVRGIITTTGNFLVRHRCLVILEPCTDQTEFICFYYKGRRYELCLDSYSSRRHPDAIIANIIRVSCDHQAVAFIKIVKDRDVKNGFRLWNIEQADNIIMKDWVLDIVHIEASIRQKKRELALKASTCEAQLSGDIFLN